MTTTDQPDRPSPNSLLGVSPDGTNPNAVAEPRDLPGQFERITMQRVGDVRDAQRALDTSRHRGVTAPIGPAAPDPRPVAPPEADLRSGDQSQQASELAAALRRRP